MTVCDQNVSLAVSSLNIQEKEKDDLNSEVKVSTKTEEESATTNGMITSKNPVNSTESPTVDTHQTAQILGKDSPILTESLQRIWLSWDSPVEGVGEYVVAAFKSLLEVWNLEVTNGRCSHDNLAEELAAKVIQMPWFSRSRYKPLALLLPYVNVDKVGGCFLFTDFYFCG
jgi:hypothetical protein